MSLFEVPGWSVKTAPVREESHAVSKKRKRTSSSINQTESAEINVEKLMAKLANTQPEVGSNRKAESKKRRKTQKQNNATAAEKPKEYVKGHKTTQAPGSEIIGPFNESVSEITHASSQVSSSKPKKQTKTKQAPESSESTPASSQNNAAASTKLTALQKSMKNSLDGARFRLINENLYKTDSHRAHQMMQEDPKVFEEYHTGFRHQVVSWPINPVEHFASMFATYPQKTIIADLGCGDAALAKNLVPKGISVISFDLVSDKEYVVDVDICDKIPLPGSESAEGKDKTSGAGQVVDVVVCALSLMGVNWPNCIREAWRILKPGGELHIAEVTSRFTNVEQFQILLGSIGFRLKSKNDSISTHFILFEFSKIPRANKTDKEWTKLLSKGAILKPCEYKRR